MEEEMIERVATAIYMADWQGEPLTEWEDISLRDQDQYRLRAMAAIEAMHDLTVVVRRVCTLRPPDASSLSQFPDLKEEGV